MCTGCEWLDEWLTWSRCVPTNLQLCGEGKRIRVRGPKSNVFVPYSSLCTRQESAMCEVPCTGLINRSNNRH